MYFTVQMPQQEETMNVIPVQRPNQSQATDVVSAMATSTKEPQLSGLLLTSSLHYPNLAHIPHILGN